MGEVLREAIKDALKGASLRAKEKFDAEKKDKESNDKYLSNEKTLYPEKLILANSIFEWGEEFRRKNEYKELQRLLENKPIAPKNALEIYGSMSWGHEMETYPGSGQWSDIYLLDKGGFAYIHGYRWHGASTPIEYKTVQSLAKGLNHQYLEKLKQSLASGKAEERIAKNLRE